MERDDPLQGSKFDHFRSDHSGPRPYKSRDTNRIPAIGASPLCHQPPYNVESIIITTFKLVFKCILFGENIYN